MLSFSPKIVTKELLATLPERSRDVLVFRYGLGKDGSKRTLESIGSDYNITRERVRQIESHGLGALRESDAYKTHVDAILDLESAIRKLGSVLAEEDVLIELPKTKGERNYIQFLLTVGQPFTHQRENNDFVKRWSVDSSLSGKVHDALSILHDTIDPDNLIPEDEFLQTFTNCLLKAGIKEKEPTVLKRWLSLTKRIGRNPLGEWGRSSSPNVRVKSMRDLAYLTLKRHGSPMHFTEVALNIEKLFGRKAHPATCHNELIKDSRFVLVGRGLYALKEWGYEPGVVREVVSEVLRKNGPLSREEIIERVKRERYVKDATITVNLQDDIFRRLPDGRYELS
jgi:hypothetical protein